MACRRFSRAFTLIELLIVIFILTILASIGAVSFSKTLKNSRMDQAVQLVRAAIYAARYQAQSQQKVVCLLFGDDTSRLASKPTDDILPAAGEIEMWTVQCADDQMQVPSGVPIGITDAFKVPNWLPFCTKVQCLSRYSLPEHIRVVSGADCVQTLGDWSFSFDTNPGTFVNAGSFGSLGELKRHIVPFFTDGLGVYNRDMPYVLVFDDVTGEHVVIRAAANYSNFCSARPRIITRRLAKVGGTPLNDWSKLGSIVDAYTK